ncbi:hypothetical protein GCM10018966_100650 [Streptomyces yanii]
MVQKLDPEIARKRMISYGMEPTVLYPGRVDAPWPGICLECKQPGSPTLSNAKRQGVCAPCGQARAAEALRLPLSEVVRALMHPMPRALLVTNGKFTVECIKWAQGEKRLILVTRVRLERWAIDGLPRHEALCLSD